MKFGVQVGCYRTTWDDIRTSIETLEAGRWDSLWFADHFLPPSPGSPTGDREQERLTAFEGYTLTAVAAGMTQKLRLGHLVLFAIRRCSPRWPPRSIRPPGAASFCRSAPHGSAGNMKLTDGTSHH